MTDRSADHDGVVDAGAPEAVGWASLLVDGTSRVIEWSEGAERLLGHRARDIVNRPLLDLLPDSASGVPLAAEVLVEHADGGTIGCRIRAHAVPEHGTGTVWRVEFAPSAEGGSPALEQALLDALFTRSPIGLFVLDPELRLVRYNAAAEGMPGLGTRQALGLTPRQAWPDLAAHAAEQVMAEVLRTGEPVIGFEKRGRPPGDPEHEHVYSAAMFRLEDENGRVLGVADTVVDVTDRHAAQQRLALAAEAGTRVGTTLDVLRTAGELAELVVPRLADSIAVDLLAPVLSGEEPPRAPGGEDLLRAASRSIRSDAESGVYAVGETSGYPRSAPAVEVLGDRRPRLVRELDADSAWVTADPVRGRRMLEEGVHSLMVVPLNVRDRVLGLAAFHRWGSRAPFDENDLALAQDLAGRTAVALDNARRYVREHNAVVSLQRGLLPRALTPPSTIHASHHLVLSGAGGDWTDVLPLPGARAALVAGRTPGRGMQTAAAMGRLRTAVRALADLDLAPDEIMARLDDLVRQTDAENPGADGLAGTTCLYVVHEPLHGRCTAAAAGPAGLALVLPDGGVSFPDLVPGAPLGRPGPPFAKSRTDLPDGSRLVLYTPGLLQSFPDEVARATLARLLASSTDSPEDLCLRLTETLVPVDPPEDAAVLVADTRAMDPTRVAEWELPPDPAAVATARSVASDKLRTWALQDEAFATELIVSELVTNAIRYARPPIRLRLIHDRRLTCEVFDGSSAAPHLRHARASDEGGRGLLLVSQFAERWGTRQEEIGKTIWAEQPLATPA
ncbi:SpoIIE family protein phosphatase [Streptomyces sp. NPDC002309]